MVEDNDAVLQKDYEEDIGELEVVRRTPNETRLGERTMRSEANRLLLLPRR